MFSARPLALAAALALFLPALSLPARAQQPAPSQQASPAASTERARYLKGEWPSGEKLISMDFDRRSTRESLKQLAAAAGWSLSFKASPHGRVHLTFNQVPADEVLLTMLKEHDLSAERHGTMITIQPGPEEADDESAEDSSAKGGEHVGIGKSVHVAAGETVREAISIGGEVDVQGTVLGDAVSIGGLLTLGPTAVVKGDAVCVGCRLESNPGARVGGDRVSVDLGSIFGHGERTAQPTPAVSKSPSWLRSHLTSLAKSALRFAVSFVLGLLLLALIPDRLQAIGKELRRSPLPSIGIGMVGVILLVPLSVVLAVTIIGILPLVVLWLFVPVAVLAGYTAIAIEVGTRVAPAGRRAARVAVLLFGVLALFVVYLVPYLGPLALWVISLSGFGAVLRTRFGSGSAHNANFAPTP